MPNIYKSAVNLFIASFAIILAILPFHAFISTWGGTAIGPLLLWKSWKELVLVVLLPVVITYLFFNRAATKTLWNRLINRLILLYFSLSLVWASLSQASLGAVAAGLMFNLRFFAMFLLGQIVAQSGYVWVDKLKKIIPTALLYVSLVVSVFAILQVTVLPADFLTIFGYNKNNTIAPYLLLDDNQNALRAFSTLRGPNTLGAFLLLPLALAAMLFINKKKRFLSGLVILTGLVALFLSGSRSAWLGAGVTFVVLALVSISLDRLKILLKWGLIPVIGGIIILGILATSVPALRLIVFHSSPTDNSLLEGSSLQHWQATINGISDIIANPLGLGIGTAGPASFYNNNVVLAENYFVQIGQEMGVIGLAVFIAINVLMFLQLYRNKKENFNKVLLASFVGLTVINVFLHAWADDPTSMIWWGLAGLFAFKVGSKVKT